MKKRLVNTLRRLLRPALSLEGERSDTQAGLLAHIHRLPLLPGSMPVESWGRLQFTVTGSHRTCTGFPIHPLRAPECIYLVFKSITHLAFAVYIFYAKTVADIIT